MVVQGGALLHPYRDEPEIVSLIQATLHGEPIRQGEIERAVANSKSAAWHPGETSATPTRPKKPTLNHALRESIIKAGTMNLVELWKASPVRLHKDDGTNCAAIVTALFAPNGEDP